jgi:hypothetical protein
MTFETFSIILYTVSAIFCLLAYGIDMYIDWRSGTDIKLGEFYYCLLSFIPLVSTVILISVVFMALNKIGNKVVIKGKN